MVKIVRFKLTFKLKKEEIPLDYRRYFLFFLKTALKEEAKEFYYENYESFNGNKINRVKPFTFSLLLNNPKFLEDKIILDNSNVIFNFSCYEYEWGINFYNSMTKMLNKPFDITKDNTMTLESINMMKNRVVRTRTVVFKTMSPIIVRHHDKDGRNNALNNHLSYSDEGFLKQLKVNILESLKCLNDFSEYEISRDIEKMTIEMIRMKSVWIAHFTERIKKRVIGNVGVLKIIAEPYILDFLYKAGIGSRRSQGFGMVEIAVVDAKEEVKRIERGQD
ncbi:MAG: CRISPR-associated endoribonuclease Cas6 [Firmicutes bacterium HGW-Firmicutes-7]|nr:MAG: CRISPR-associated endoribonuclease Cas6 [Firmicutes bacterium HGW-Firmicutes-7]